MRAPKERQTRTRDWGFAASVIRERPEFAQRMGVVIATFSRAEYNIALLVSEIWGGRSSTTYEIYRSLTPGQRKNTRKVLNSLLVGDDLEEYIKIDRDFTGLATERAKVAHGIFAANGAEEGLLYHNADDLAELDLAVLTDNSRPLDGEIWSGNDLEVLADDLEDLAVRAWTMFHRLRTDRIRGLASPFPAPA